MTGSVRVPRSRPAGRLLLLDLTAPVTRRPRQRAPSQRTMNSSPKEPWWCSAPRRGACANGYTTPIQAACNCPIVGESTRESLSVDSMRTHQAAKCSSNDERLRALAIAMPKNSLSDGSLANWFMHWPTLMASEA